MRYGSGTEYETEDDKRIKGVLPMFQEILESFEIPITGYAYENKKIEIIFKADNCKITDTYDILYDYDETILFCGLPLYPQGFKNVLKNATIDFQLFITACENYNKGQKAFIAGSRENHKLIDKEVYRLANKVKEDNPKISNNRAADMIIAEMNCKPGQYPSKSQVISLITDIIPPVRRGKNNK